MNVDPAELDKRIEIFKIEKGDKDEDGFQASLKVQIRKCWAKFTRNSGTETIKLGADFENVKCRFLIRYTKIEINRKMLVKYKRTWYEIKDVNNYGDNNEFIELTCEVSTNGEI